MKRLAQALPQSPRLRNNNFDLIRLVLALIVCFVHLSVLTGGALLPDVESFLSAAVAVKGFFVISGFLIFKSGETARSLKPYVSNRIRRIYPAYAFIIIVCAALLFFISPLPAASYFSLAWLKYIAANLCFLNFIEPTLPGVFADNIWTPVNGALWTLKVEVMFYCAVPFLIWMMNRFGRWSVLAGLYGLSCFYSSVMFYLAQKTGQAFYIELSRQLPGQLSYFLAGASLYYALPLFEKRRFWFLFPASLCLVIHAFIPLSWIEPAALAVVVLFLALFVPLWKPSRYGDFSYGVYIVHFPIVQVYWSEGWFANVPFFQTTAILFTVFCAAFFLWHGVEKRFLVSRNHYVAEMLSESPAS